MPARPLISGEEARRLFSAVEELVRWLTNR